MRDRESLRWLGSIGFSKLWASRWALGLVASLHVACLQANTEMVAVDSLGQRIVRETPAQRVVSLAPHMTELLFSAGAGDYLVGRVAYSDYPAEATQAPIVASAGQVDIEAIVALKPDLVLAWRSGTPAAALETLRRLGIQLYVSESSTLEEIAQHLRGIGELVGKADIAEVAAQNYLQNISQLRHQYRNRASLKVFYQIWQEPLMTVNGQHVISEVIQLCGGINVFSDVSALAPQVNIEAVLERAPEVILASQLTQNSDGIKEFWAKWTQLPAVAQRQLYGVPWDLISRHSLRIAEGAEYVCRSLDQARTQ